MWTIVSLVYSLIFGTLVSIILLTINRTEQDINIYTNHTLPKYNNEELITIEKVTRQIRLTYIFRPMVRDVLKNNYEQTDEFLIKWILEYNSDLRLADSMLRKAQQWKEDNNWYTISEETHLILKNNTCFSDGVDRQGNLILYSKLPQEDIRKWVLRGLKQNFTRTQLTCLKEGIGKSFELSKETGKLDLGLFVISDMEGYNLKQHGCLGCIDMFGEMTKLAKIFPGIWKVIVVINGPTILLPLVDLMRPLLPARTQLEIKIFGREKKEWFSFLSKRVNMDQLSKRYGGKRNN